MTEKLALSALDWVVCLAALVASILIGLLISVLKRSSQSSDGFFLAGRSLTWPVVGASLFATNISAEHLVGLSGDSYRYGLCAGTVELTTAICLGFAAAVLLPHYFRNRISTIPEFLELRYGPAARTFFSGLMVVICIMTKTAFTLYAGAMVLHLLTGWDIMTTVLLLAAATALITVIGGFTTVAYTDAIQTIIMLIGSGWMTYIGLTKVGWWPGLVARVPDMVHMAKPFDDPNYPFWGIIAGAVYGGIFYWGMDQVNVQRLLGARDLRQARWGAMFAILLKLFPVFIFALPGVIAFALFPGREPKTIFVTLLNELLPHGLRGLLLASLLAALVSSLLAIMNSISTLAVRDFVVKIWPKITEQGQVYAGRIAIVVSALLAIVATWLIARSPEGLYKYLQTISIYLVMPVTPSIAFGIMSKKVTKLGALVSVCVGVLLATLFVVDQQIGPELGSKWFPMLHKTLTLNYTYRGLWGTIIVVFTLFAVSAFTPKTAPEILEKTTITWGWNPDRFEGLKDWRLQLAVLSVITVFAYWFVH